MTAEPRNAHSQAGRQWAAQIPRTLFTGVPSAPLLNTGLVGPYPLRYEQIQKAIGRVAAGAYALGYASADGGFGVLMVGRSDTDLGSTLTNHIGTQSLFKFVISGSPMLAFEKECELFHDFSPPNNRRHPERAAGTKWTCPRCRQFGS